MSDFEGSQASSDADNSVTIEMFQCRKCPGQLFTGAEKDSHRRMHKEEKEKEKDRQKRGQLPSTSSSADKPRKPGPLSRRGPSLRATSPANSGVTLFAPVTSPNSQVQDENVRPKRNREQNGTDYNNAESPASRGPKRKKIRSVKRGPEPVSFNTTTGG